MFIAKHKKIIFSLTAAAVMGLGGITAFAATSGISLTPVSNVDLSDIDAPEGEVIYAGEIDREILESMKGAVTLPGAGADYGPGTEKDSAAALTAVPGDIDIIEDQAVGEAGDFKIAGKVDPRILESMKDATTAPGPAKDIKK